MDSEAIARLVTADRILAFCPKADPDVVEALVTDAPAEFPKAGLTSQAAIAHFLGQIATETGGLGRLDENLNYTTAARLCKIFPSGFPTEDSARPFVRNPEKLANRVYDGKNGNKSSGDGWLYRGSGLIQITGRGNFRTLGKLVDMPLEDQPELARQPDSAVRVALGYWCARNIAAVAGEQGDSAVAKVTKLINPAMVGLAARQANTRKAIKILATAPAKPRDLGVAAMPAPRGMAGPELSGPAWVARFPTSRSLDDLLDPFRTHAKAFVAALEAGGATVRISATHRPKERAYLMHWAFLIAQNKVDPAVVPPMPGVDIRWAHPTAARSRAAAKQMVRGYGMVQVAALNSRHTESKAVDMTISWSGDLEVATHGGSTVRITGGPRNGSNGQLIEVGRGYGVIKLVTDPPHWSDDGR